LQNDWKLIPDTNNNLKLTLVSPEASKGNLKRQPTALPAMGSHKRVFVLFPKQSPAYDIAMNKILGVFASKKIPAVFTAINFDQNPELAQAALEIARSEQFSLIFAMGSESTALLYENFKGESIPVVSVCAKDPVLLGQMKDYRIGSGSNIAFTSLNVPVEVQMAYLKKLKPNLKNIAVMYDTENKSAIETQVKPLLSIAETSSINIIEVAVNQETARENLEVEIPNALAQIARTDSINQNSIFWITGSTSVFREIATINQLANKVAVLSVVPDVVTVGDNSAILAIGVSFESNAYLAALYGIDILQGKAQVSQLPVGVVSPPDIAINFRKAQKIKLKIPFSFFESASFVYDSEGKMVRDQGKRVGKLI
jgi:putative ABC transport system substrate-binding protein